MKILKIGFILFIIFILNNSFAQYDNVLVSKGEIVLIANWGDSVDEVGLIKESEIEPGGPLSFCVAAKNIILLDNVKNRVITNSDSKTIKTIMYNVRAWDITSDGGFGFFTIYENEISHFNQKGFEIDKFNISPKVKIIQGYGSNISILNNTGLIVNNVDQKSYSIASGSYSQGFKQIINDPQKYTIGKNGVADNLSYSIKRLSGDDIRILGSEEEGKNIVSIKINLDGEKAGAVLFKGQDLSGNLYVEIEKIINNKANLEVHSYNKNGERLSVIKMPNNYYTTVYKKTEISPDGSVYQMLTTSDGVQIIRY